jgi:flagellar hook-basal body complex protein FliE
MNKISGIQSQYLDLIKNIKAPDEKIDEQSFKEVINQFIQDVDGMQKASDQAVKDYASGEMTDIHQVMIAAEEANLSFQLLMEVRNRLVESYREIMRMQS